MKHLLILLVLMVPTSLMAHSGGVDSSGGHCERGPSSWFNKSGSCSNYHSHDHKPSKAKPSKRRGRGDSGTGYASQAPRYKKECVTKQNPRGYARRVGKRTKCYPGFQLLLNRINNEIKLTPLEQQLAKTHNKAREAELEILRQRFKKSLGDHNAR